MSDSDLLVDPVTPWQNWGRVESSTPAYRARPTSVTNCATQSSCAGSWK